MFSRPFKKQMRASVLVLLLSLTLLISGCSQKQITGNEWLLKQKECLDTIEIFAEEMDEVYSLYIVGSMTEEDFIAEVRLLKAQHGVLTQYYDQLRSENPVKEGSHSYVSKRGSEGMEKCYKALGEMLDSSIKEDGRVLSVDELAYLYLAYRQEFSAAISEYVTAVVWLEESGK